MSKKIWALLAAMMLLMLAVVPAAMANTITTKYVKAPSGNSVHMRSGPGTSYDILLDVPCGNIVEIYSEMKNPSNESWSEIGYNGTTGWMMTRYLSTSKPTSNSGSSSSSTGSSDMNAMFKNFKDVGVTADILPSTPGNFVNMRWAPSKSAPVQARYYEGQQVYVLKANKSWCQVYDAENNRSGFIMRSLLNY